VHDRADVPWLIQVHIERVPVGLEQSRVGGERLRDPRLGVVEVVQVAAEARRIRLDQIGFSAR
jgi:hypothetical protein